MNLILKHILIAALMTGMSIPALAAKKKAAKRIVKISLKDPKINGRREATRRPSSVNGKEATYVPVQRTPSKKVLVVERHSDINESSLDPLIEKPPRKPAQSKTSGSKASKISAEIDPEALEQTVASAPPAVAEQSMADKSTMHRLRKNAEKAINEDYF